MELVESMDNQKLLIK